MSQPAPEDYSDEELLAMLKPAQLAELDRQIGDMFGAERDETSALAMLQLAAAMRRRAELMLAARN